MAMSCPSCGSKHIKVVAPVEFRWGGYRRDKLNITEVPYYNCGKCNRAFSHPVSYDLANPMFTDLVPAGPKEVTWDEYLGYVLMEATNETKMWLGVN